MAPLNPERMPQGGLFITLYDEETLKLYLDRELYGQHLPPLEGEPSPQSNHYPTLADYACARGGNHVFFFLKRRIYYGGQIRGPSNRGAFYINGQKSPLGREADAPVVWDESQREVYGDVGERGLFEVNEDRVRCQPYLILFEDQRDLAGTYVSSDALYFELGEYPYPLPSNTIQGMGFCTLTPGETDILLGLLEEDAEGSVEPVSGEEVELQGDPVPFSPEHMVSDVEDANPESHLEAAVLANPSLLPEALQPDDAALCRQVPISPFKPSQMDRADVCYFTDDQIRDGTIPNTIIELKNRKAGKKEALQIVRYLRWLHKRLGRDADEIEVYAYAPGYTSTFDGYIPEECREQLQKITSTDDKRTMI